MSMFGQPGPRHPQTHPARKVCASTQVHIVTSTPKFGALFEAAGRPDLQWFVASAYYVIGHAYGDAQTLEEDVTKCVNATWDVSRWFPTFRECVRCTGVVLVKTNTGSCDFVDGHARVTCSINDKLLMLLVLLFGINTCWADGVPEEGPEPVKAYVLLLRTNLAKRYPATKF